MDRATILEHLEQAERHTAEGARHIERQQHILADLQKDGHNEAAAQAAQLLAEFRELQALHVSDRDRLLRELAEIND